ncbi:hemagglutinin repeat-containing protein [Stenotrophomonas maltophilia]|uniref:hemagglutinin repeat-containing protein n=1 Tax=Stenotrophomonas maltophilia TaxID=40324 RepID=UPI00034C70F4|nr:hemagglutinin repeat-containing protein [Stenotrophomonas maltophilia]MBH1798218.1 hemagglutinin repeat-containing protein [Stenotrophomonas maltophilia]
MSFSIIENADGYASADKANGSYQSVDQQSDLFAGNGGYGVYVYAEASVGSSKANAESSTWQNTTLTGQNISLKAEGDTTLRGATATADRIDVKTGGPLTIESLQDIAESISRNSQVGGRVQVAFGNAWNADGYQRRQGRGQLPGRRPAERLVCRKRWLSRGCRSRESGGRGDCQHPCGQQ